MKFLSPNVKIKKTIVQPQTASAPAIQTKVATDAYRDNFDAIFGTKQSNSENLPTNDNQSK
jgi:hypothetical protein